MFQNHARACVIGHTYTIFNNNIQYGLTPKAVVRAETGLCLAYTYSNGSLSLRHGRPLLIVPEQLRTPSLCPWFWTISFI